MGVLNAIFAASSSLLLGLTAFELWEDTLSAATATILYSFSPLVWQYATTPEVLPPPPPPHPQASARCLR